MLWHPWLQGCEGVHCVSSHLVCGSLVQDPPEIAQLPGDWGHPVSLDSVWVSLRTGVFYLQVTMMMMKRVLFLQDT